MVGWVLFSLGFVGWVGGCGVELGVGAVVGVLVGFGWGLGGGKEMLRMEGGRKGSVCGGCEWRRVDAAMEVAEKKIGCVFAVFVVASR